MTTAELLALPNGSYLVADDIYQYELSVSQTKDVLGPDPEAPTDLRIYHFRLHDNGHLGGTFCLFEKIDDAFPEEGKYLTSMAGIGCLHVHSESMPADVLDLSLVSSLDKHKIETPQ